MLLLIEEIVYNIETNSEKSGRERGSSRRVKVGMSLAVCLQAPAVLSLSNLIFLSQGNPGPPGPPGIPGGVGLQVTPPSHGLFSAVISHPACTNTD